MVRARCCSIPTRTSRANSHRNGREVFIVQYPGPTTGERPIYGGRFNMAERKAVASERVDL